MNGTLIIETGPLKGERLPLSGDKAVGIGRDTRCAIRLPDNMVSRIHCVVGFQSGRWRIVDKKSSNGTLLNGVPVSDHTLTPGDMIQVGETIISFSTEDRDPLVGQTVGGYRIEDRLGRGAMGTVYLAHQISVDRPVALKILDPRLAGDEAFVKTFLEEARAAGRLNHPNVVAVYDAGQGGDVTYISMEYLEGGSIEELLVKEGRLPPATAVPMAIDAAEALSFAERQRIVHRDIKPANLLLDADGIVKICDLGIAADLRSPGKGSALGKIVGSPRYMAPEQALGLEVDHRADIYALGATIYKMICGVSPHEGQTVQEIIDAKLQRDPVPLREKVPEVSAPLSAVVQKMMERKRERRQANAREVQEALAKALRHAPVRRHRTRAVPRRQPMNPMVLVGAIGAAALVAIILLISLRGGAGRDRDVASPGTASVPRSGGAVPGPAPVVPAAADAEAGERAAIKEIGEVYLAWRNGSSSPDEAEKKLQAIAERWPRESVRRQVDTTLASIRKGETQKADEVARVLSEAETRVKDFLAKGDIRAAAAVVAEIESGHPAARTESLRKSIDEAISAALARLGEEIAPAVREGAFAAAREKIAAVAAVLPAGAEGGVAALRKKVDAAEQAIRTGEKAIARAATDVRRKVASLDFDGAEKALDAVVAGNARLEASAAGLRREVALAREAWAAIAQAIAPGKTVRLRLSPGPLAKQKPTPTQLRVDSLDGPAVRLQTPGKQAFATHAVLSLETEDLLQLVGGAAGAEGLGILVLLRSGAERAGALLLPPGADAARQEAVKSLVGAVGDSWITTRQVEAEKRLEAYTAAPPKADAWSYVAREAAELIVAVRSKEGSAQTMEALRKLYLQARQAALALEPAEGFFHAKTVKIESGGMVKLAYDFSTEDQLLDFLPAGEALKDPLRWIKGKKGVTIGGEVRFLRGDPFRSRLTIRGTAVPANAEKPNVNVALWTGPKDVLTVGLDGKGIDLERWRNAGGEEPVDYFLIGMGYRLPFEITDLAGGDRGFERLLGGLKGFLPLYLRESGLVILSGKRGSTLHRDRRELVWEAAAGNQVRPPVRYSVEIDAEGRLQWTLNGKRVPFSDSLRLDRLKLNLPRQGSFSILTNGSEVLYTALEVEGELHPEWLRSEARVLAEKELEELAGKPAPPLDPSAAGASSG